MADDVRSQLQTMARWADAQHEPIDPGVALGRVPLDDEVLEWPDGWPAEPPPSSPTTADRRRWLVVAAAVLAIVIGTSVAVVRRDGGTVDIPPAVSSPNGWSQGAS